MTDNEINKQVEILRKLKGKTLSELAESTTISISAISKYFQGKTELGSTKFINLLEELDLSIPEVIKAKISEVVTGKTHRNSILNDLVFLFEKLDDINKKIVLTSVIKSFKYTKDSNLKDKVSRIKKELNNL